MRFLVRFAADDPPDGSLTMRTSPGAVSYESTRPRQAGEARTTPRTSLTVSTTPVLPVDNQLTSSQPRAVVKIKADHFVTRGRLRRACRGTDNASTQGRYLRVTEGSPRRCRMAPTATWAEGIPDRAPVPPSVLRHARSVFVCLALTGSVLLASCSSSPTSSRLPGSASSTTDPTAATNNAVLSAWRAAETAFYQAEANPQGLYSPALPATMVDPELQLVKTNLGDQEAKGFIGHGTWNLGTPRVISLGPTETDPTTGTVVSCIDD